MGFLPWHYSIGLSSAINFLSVLIDSVFHNFSFVILIRSLFAPWKRMQIEDNKPGFNLERALTDLSFNFISRGVGFCVRLLLLFAGLILTVLATIFGLFVVALWIVFPLIGIPFYLRYRGYHKFLIQEIKPGSLFDNEAGKFVIEHTKINKETLMTKINVKGNSDNLLQPKSYADLVQNYFNHQDRSYEAVMLAANWWDKKKVDKETSDQSGFFARPSLGLELLYGYTPFLDQYSTDLSYDQNFSHHLIGRGKSVELIERTLDAGNSVALVGNPGVGKKTVVLEFARRAYLGKLGPEMSYRRILEFDANALLSGGVDINTKKVGLANALQEATTAGNIILVIRDIHRITNATVEGLDFTDVFEKYLEKRELKIITILTNTDYERFVVPNMRLRKYLEKVEVIAPTKEEALEIICDAATAWEEKRKIIITVGAVKKILEGSDRYVSETPFPEKALEILDSVVEYGRNSLTKTVTEDDVNLVLSEKTGISLSRLTEREKGLLNNLENLIHQNLVDQEEAVSLIAKSLRSRTVGVNETNQPIGSFLFLGPTGVGKTETAKVLANIYYGSEEAILRFDMAQYADNEAVGRLIGSTISDRPGDLTTAIKNHPASLLLLDEIEKGGRLIHNLLLTALDEGYITDAFGKKISCRNLFIIGTSNADAEFVREAVKNGSYGEKLQQMVIEDVQQKGLFYPEFLNRFDGVIVYTPLSIENATKVAALQLNKLKENLKKRGIELEITDELVSKLTKDGFNPAYGARPMRRIIDLSLGDLIGKAILSGNLQSGDRIKFTTNPDFALVKL